CAPPGPRSAPAPRSPCPTSSSCSPSSWAASPTSERPLHPRSFARTSFTASSGYPLRSLRAACPSRSEHMKTSTQRILTTHVGSIPRPESITTLLRARLSGQAIDEAKLAKHVADAIGEVVRRQAEAGLDVVSDGEMGKTTFLGYTDERLAGFVPLKANDPNVPFSNVGGSWTRRTDTRREWQAFREYYQEYLPR